MYRNAPGIQVFLVKVDISGRRFYQKTTRKRKEAFGLGFQFGLCYVENPEHHHTSAHHKSIKAMGKEAHFLYCSLLWCNNIAETKRTVVWHRPRNKMCKSQPWISSISVTGINGTLKKSGFLYGPKTRHFFNKVSSGFWNLRLVLLKSFCSRTNS